MGEYISRSEILGDVLNTQFTMSMFLSEQECHAARMAQQILGRKIEQYPAADVVEVKHGAWVKLDMHRGMEQYKCSSCNTECYVPECMGEPLYSYCPNCGAKMDGGGNGE